MGARLLSRHRLFLDRVRAALAMRSRSLRYASFGSRSGFDREEQSDKPGEHRPPRLAVTAAKIFNGPLASKADCPIGSLL